MKKIIVTTLLAFTGAGFTSLHASGEVAGLTLLKPYGARPAALGEAFTAVTNDITAFGYNPASLKSLQSTQASFLYEKGFIGDSYGQFVLGSPSKVGHMGISVGYYNAGSIELIDESLNSRNVNAQTDLTMNIGYANSIGKMSWGTSAKFIRSELIDQYTANAFALDAGLQGNLGSRIGLGASFQNLGTSMTYAEESDPLPLIYRAGASLLLFSGPYAPTLLLDVPYYSVEQDLRPAVGVEVTLGLLAIRSGYRKVDGINNEFTVGAGFMLGQNLLDYSFGMVDQANSQHLISFSMKFANASKNAAFTKAPPIVPPQQATQTAQRRRLGDMGNTTGSVRRQIYEVKANDTLDRIAIKFYGDSDAWAKIYFANRHIITDPETLEPGQKIILPSSN